MGIEDESIFRRTRKKLAFANEPTESPRWPFSKSNATTTDLRSEPTARLQRTEQQSNISQKPSNGQPATSTMAPPTTSKPERRQSKMSLFDLFSKPKVERSRGYHETGLAPVIEIPKPKPKPPVTTPRVQPRLDHPTVPSKSQPDNISNTPATSTQPLVFNSAAHTNARPQSPQNLRVSTSPSITSDSFVGQRVQSRTTSQRHLDPPTVCLTRPMADWEPPPLFQAYPQSIKHAKIPTPSSSAESLVRGQAHRRQYSLLQNRVDSLTSFGTSSLDLNGDGASDAGSLRNGSKRLSTTVTKDSFVRLDDKIFVLVTAGYVLQYAGSGPSDRKPEKILRLGPQSAAFASDLIPGRHWVLQICERVDQSGRNTPGLSTSANDDKVRGFFRRLGSRAHGKTRSTSLFLLVLESPEEMDLWLKAMRKAIGDLSGRKREPEPGCRSSEDQKNEERPVHRFSVHREKMNGSLRSGVGSSLSSPRGSRAGSRLTSPTQSRTASPATSPLATTFPLNARLSIISTKRKSPDSTISIVSPERSDVLQEPPPPIIPAASYNHQSPASAGSSVSTATSTLLSADTLRESSRHSFVSSQASEAETENTSVTVTNTPESSPTPVTPHFDNSTSIPPKSDESHLRNPAGMKSSYRSSMAPNGNAFSPAATNWRRSVQALPRTSEDSLGLPSTDNAVSASITERVQKARLARNSVVSPANGMQPLILTGQVVSEDAPLRTPSSSSLRNGSISSSASKASSASSIHKILPPVPDAKEDEPVAISNAAISRDIEPLAPLRKVPSANSIQGSASPSDGPTKTIVTRRASFRPFPVRPSVINTAGSNIDSAAVHVPRRNSSLPTTSMEHQRTIAGPLPLTLTSTRSLQTIPQSHAITTPETPSRDSPTRTPQKDSPTIPGIAQTTSRNPRRPTSLQVRSDHAPFLSSRPRNSSTSFTGFSSALPPGSTIGPTLSQAIPYRSASHSALSSLDEHAISTPGAFSAERTSIERHSGDSNSAPFSSSRFRPRSTTPTSNPRRSSALNFSLPYRINPPVAQSASESPTSTTNTSPVRVSPAPNVLPPRDTMANGSAHTNSAALPPMKPVPMGPLPIPPSATRGFPPSPTGGTNSLS